MTTLEDENYPDDYVHSYRVHWHLSRRHLSRRHLSRRYLSRRHLSRRTLAVVITNLVVMVSCAQIVIGRLIRVAPDVIVFFGNIVGIIVVNTIQ